MYINETYSTLRKFEGNLRTTYLHNKFITFEKCYDVEKTDDNYEKVMMDYEYVYRYGYYL